MKKRTDKKITETKLFFNEIKMTFEEYENERSATVFCKSTA
jgi:hypothetical protein